MTLIDIEEKVKASGYEMVIFDGNSFPQHLKNTHRLPYIRFNVRKITREHANFSGGWMVTEYDYHGEAHLVKMLFTNLDTFMSTKKLRLLQSIKDFV